ncbi:cell division protein CrgA [Luteimicrobium subarcticum]|uniref:Cell division protein CrgA n=1 Tax=Luteimicrobium subarcticum TaxID=620910 RepID=A0A2M8WJE6_9MICO|nr:cell division protein CrgA [Luteimicrobium subarcticum]PJI91057.1 uncharacterized protein UPF0233 [Luteimicrobium subarcticum]
MPESKRRKKAHHDAPAISHKADAANPQWFAPVVFGLMIMGLVWVVLFYLTSGKADLPIPAIGRWNLAVGFALMLTGFGMLTRWK